MTNVRTKNGEQLKSGDYICVPNTHGLMEAKEIISKRISDTTGDWYISIQNYGDAIIKLYDYYLVAEIDEDVE